MVKPPRRRLFFYPIQACLFGKYAVLVLLACTLCACQKAPKPPTDSPHESPSDFSSASPSPSLKGIPIFAPHPSASPSPVTSDEKPDPISDVLCADLTPGETASRLLSLLVSTPADDKSFLVQIAGNYCPDEEYWRLLPLLLDRSQPEDVRDELMRDILRRPDAVRLRPLYRLALDPTHPLSTEAREYLFSYLADVPENDFNALARAIDKAEKENP